MEQISTVEKINTEINHELLNPTTQQALLATTFKKLDVKQMKQALMEGMIRGFTFKDFLEKNVYAIPYGQTYSLVTSIDYTRKVAMRSGLSGKSAPTYTFDKDNKVETCTVTVYKKGGHDAGYTATVYFSEYTTSQNLWKTKPMTMIAKVAEMHALRAAFPEEIAQQYTEEEMQLEAEKTASRAREVTSVDTTGLKIKDITKTDENKKDNESQDQAANADDTQAAAGTEDEIDLSDIVD